MKILQSKWFHWILGICGVGGSLFFLIHLSSWSQLFWPGAWFVFLLVGVVGLEMICRALRLQKVCELMASKRLSFRGSFWVGAIADIYGAATPSSVGGEVARLASLARFGIKGRESLMALALDRLVLLSSLLFVLLVSGGMVFLKDTSLFSLKSLLNTLILYFVLAGGLIVFLFIMVRREQYEMPWKKIFLKPSLFLLSMVHHVVRLGFLPLILWVFAKQAPTLQILIWSFVLGYGVSLLPVPSGGGSVEVTFMLLLKPLLGEDMASLALLWWRFSSHYFYVLIGIVITLAELTGFFKPQLAKTNQDGRA